jgi:hypothetical protein
VFFFLGEADPAAQQAAKEAAHFTPGQETPTVPEMFDFMASGAAAPYFTQVDRVADIQPGDIFLRREGGSADGIDGHAMIATSGPRPLADGNVAVTVFDSTGEPHGSDDSRHWDERTHESQGSTLPHPLHSGLGFGTIEIKPDSTGAPSQMAWSVGGAFSPSPFSVSRLRTQPDPRPSPGGSSSSSSGATTTTTSKTTSTPTSSAASELPDATNETWMTIGRTPRGGFHVARDGRVRVPLTCPLVDGGCTVHALLTASPNTVGRAARQTVIASARGLAFAPGETRRIALRLRGATRRALLGRHTRSLRAVLRTVSRFPNGASARSSRAVRLRLPRA